MTQAPEKPAAPTAEETSTNFYWTCGEKEVFNLQTTVRGHLSPAQIKMHLASVKAALTATVELGGHAKAVGRAPEASAPAPITTTTTTAQPTATATPAPVQASNGHGDQYFDAEALAGSITDGKAYWKVKGGRFTQWGVTIWPETISAAGLEVKNGELYTLKGWRAYYSTKSDGKPEKVTRLVAPA